MDQQQLFAIASQRVIIAETERDRLLEVVKNLQHQIALRDEKLTAATIREETDRITIDQLTADLNVMMNPDRLIASPAEADWPLPVDITDVRSRRR